MVAIMLLAIAIIPMVGMFDAGLRAAMLGGNYDKGRALANEKLEEIKALPYSSPDPAAAGTANSVEEIYRPLNANPAGSAVTGTEGTFTYKVETRYASLNATGIAPDPNGKMMMQVDVTVEWDAGSKSYTTTGLVSKSMGNSQ